MDRELENEKRQGKFDDALQAVGFNDLSFSLAKPRENFEPRIEK